jgi:ribosome recycling factor
MATESGDVRSVLRDGDGRMRGAIASLEDDLGGYRTGRASPHLIDKIKVEVYGAEMNLNEVAVISVPEPQQLAIRPYDRAAASAIEKAIMKSDLGIMPNNAGAISTSSLAVVLRRPRLRCAMCAAISTMSCAR